MLDVMDGRTRLGTLKPVSTGVFECFDAQGAYVGKISRVGEAAAMLRDRSKSGSISAAPKSGATSMPRAPGARTRRTA